MTEPPRSDPAGAGLTLLSTIILCGGVGLGLGALVGLPAVLGVAGVFVGGVVGVALVYARFKDL